MCSTHDIWTAPTYPRGSHVCFPYAYSITALSTTRCVKSDSLLCLSNASLLHWALGWAAIVTGQRCFHVYVSEKKNTMINRQDCIVKIVMLNLKDCCLYVCMVVMVFMRVSGHGSGVSQLNSSVPLHPNIYMHIFMFHEGWYARSGNIKQARMMFEE
jgi:hypothetical protein